uniref:ZP domain-containing protein n=1 Tax=Seriola dumerili TaxID=41447 RepID=A0A3B4UXA6_SERDU
MKTVAFIIRLVFLCCKFTERTTAAGHLEGFVEAYVQSECRDRYLWIQVASVQTPRFEAVDGNGVHSISEQLASRCGYTISTFKMDGFTTFRASYYSCFTHNQNDEVFTFRFNVIVSGGGGWISRPVSAVCSGLIWTHREIICEEDYMEAQKTAGAAWQLMFLQSDGQVSSMSISEAQTQGYSLTTTTQRMVLRSQYKQPHAKVIMVDGVPVEVIQVSLLFKRKLMVAMIDMSMACTVNSGSFDGAWLLWDVPWIMTPLVEEAVRFESQNLSVGVEGVLLDEPTATTRGFSLVQQGRLVQIRVPLGAEGGYRKSLVVNNMYKELYVIFLLYEHVFSLLHEDSSSINTRHRMLRVLDTPLLCRPPFSLDQTISDDQVFSIYLGNIPADVILEEVWINRKQLMMAENVERAISISPVVHVNGSRAYELRLPFEDAAVHWMYLGGGVVQYSIDINFTLTIMPQGDSYYHHTLITAQIFNAFPPEITAQCSDRGITFSLVRPPRAESLWEVGVDHEPLTSQLAAQRGYSLHHDTHKTNLEVPVFSIGYTYEGINLSDFYGTFKLLLRDSKTLEVQTSTSKRCLFKTEDMIVCSADGTMTVVMTPTATWPTVRPERTSLLDRTCGPKQADRSRVLFEFKVDSCGTRAMVGESYMVYENEILHDRQLIADGPNFITRESQFKLTVRCFYPLSGVNRLTVDRTFRSETPGYGSVKVFESLEDSARKVPAHECSHQVSRNAINTPTSHIHQTHQIPSAGGVLSHPGIRPRPNTGPSRFITVPGRHNKLASSSHDQQTFSILNLSAEPQTVSTHQVPQQVSSLSGHLMSLADDQNLLRYNQLQDSIKLSNLNTPSLDFVEERGEHSGSRDDIPALVLDSFSGTPGPVVAEQLESSWGSSGQTVTLPSLNSLNAQHSGQILYQSTLGQNGIVKLNQDVQNLKVDLSLDIQELNQQHETKQPLNSQGSFGGAMVNLEERSVYQPQSQYDPSQASQLRPVLQPPAQYSPDHISTTSGKLHLPSRDKKDVPTDTKHKNTVTDSSEETQESVSNEATSTATSWVHQNLKRTGSIERRNIETVQSGVQNIRVKPLSKLVSSGHQTNQKPVVKQENSQISNPSQYGTGMTAVSSDGNHWTSQQLQDHKSSNTRQEQTGFQKLKQGQGVHSVRVKLHQSAVIRLTDLSPNQQGQQQKLVQSMAEMGNSGGQESLGNVPQPTGASHMRLQVDDQSRVLNLQNPDFVIRGGTSRMTDLREDKPTDPITSSHEGLNPTSGGAGFTGSHTSLNGSGAPGSGLKIHSRSDCGSQYGSSVHQGIMRGKQFS